MVLISGLLKWSQSLAFSVAKNSSLLQQRPPESKWSMRRGLDKRTKVGQHSSTNTLIELTTNTMALKHTGLWLTIEGCVDVADTDNDKVFDTKPSHSHPPQSNHQTPTLSSLFTLKLKPPAFCPFHNTPHPSFILHIVCMPLPQPYIIWLLKRKERRGFEGEWKKRSGTFEWLFLKSHKTTQHFSTIIHTQRETKREKGKDCYGHTKRKAPLLVWSVKWSLFGPG